MTATKLIGNIDVARQTNAWAQMPAGSISNSAILDADIDTMTATKLIGNIDAAAKTNGAMSFVQVGTFTNGQPDVQFGRAFTVAPSVICDWTEYAPVYGVGTDTAVRASAITVTNFQPKTLTQTGLAYTNARYIAVGL